MLSTYKPAKMLVPGSEHLSFLGSASAQAEAQILKQAMASVNAQ